MKVDISLANLVLTPAALSGLKIRGENFVPAGASTPFTREILTPVPNLNDSRVISYAKAVQALVTEGELDTRETLFIIENETFFEMKEGSTDGNCAGQPVLVHSFHLTVVPLTKQPIFRYF